MFTDNATELETNVWCLT